MAGLRQNENGFGEPADCRVGSDLSGSPFDSHVHVGRWLSPDFLGHGTTLAETGSVLAACGIGGALVMPTDSGANLSLLAELDAYQGPLLLAAAAWAIPEDPEIADIAAHPVVRAIKIHPSFCRRPITHDCWKPALETAAARNLPVVVHCGRWQEVAGFGLLLQTAAWYPEIRFVMAHMGGDSPALVTAAAAGVAALKNRNVWMGTESIREYWLVRNAVSIAGSDRVLFGSDHNLNSPASFLAVIDAAGFDDSVRDDILKLNAHSLFRIGADS